MNTPMIQVAKAQLTWSRQKLLQRNVRGVDKENFNFDQYGNEQCAKHCGNLRIWEILTFALDLTFKDRFP